MNSSLLLVLVGLVAVVSGQINCSFKGTLTGKTYDFSKLKNDQKDYVVMVPQSATTPIPYSITFNLCRPILSTACATKGADVGACQQWPTPDVKYFEALGTASGTQFAETKFEGAKDGYGGQISLTGMTNQLNIQLLCGEGEGAPSFKEKIGQNQFFVTWTSKFACPAGSVPSGGSGGGLSVGSVMLIVLLVVTVVYFVGGILYQKLKNHASGGDLIPNRQFWSELPLLVRDGFRFVIGKIRGGGGSYQSV